MARNVEFDILARDRASATFDHVAKSSDGLGGKLGKFGSGAAKALGGAAVAVAGLGAAAGVMGLKTAAANEQAQISFTTMLGSAQKAGAFLKDLQKFAAATPFEFPELQTAASSLISAGVNASKVIPIMTTLGDVTSGMGTGAEGVKRATIALQQMNAAGRITGEDLNQLRDAGIPVYDLLAKATGKSKAEVVKLAQAGKLGQKELGQMMKALESGKGLERFSGLMDKQSRSLSGLWATFKDTLNMGLARTVEPLIPLLKDGLGKASEFLAAALPKVAAGLQRILQGAAGLYSLIVKGDFSKNFRQAFHLEEDSKVVDFLFRLRDGVQAVAGWITGTAVPAVQRFWGWISGSLWPAVREGYQTILPSLKQAFSIVAGAFKGTGVDGAKFGDVLRKVGEIIVGYVIPFVAKLISYYLPVLATNIRSAIEVVKVLYGTFTTWRDVVARVISFIVDKFGDMMSVWAGVLRALSHVPGFGWAKSAADKMQNAADKAHNISRAIAEIPNSKTVTVNVMSRVISGRIPDGHGGQINAGMRADGGPIRAGRPYMVGENGPELVIPRKDGMVIPNDLAAQIRNSGAIAAQAGNDQHVTVQLVLDGKVIQQSLLKLKRQGGVTLGLA